MKLKDLYGELRTLQSKMLGKKKAESLLEDLRQPEGRYCEWATPPEREALRQFLEPALEEAVKQLDSQVEALEIDAELTDLLSAPEKDVF